MAPTRFVMLCGLTYNRLIMEPLHLSQIIHGRRAIRRYQDRPVSRKLLDRLLEAAMWAPSAHNRQPWRFAVLTELQDKQRLAEAMGEQLRRDRMKDGDPREAVEKDVARSFQRITGAPVVIGLFLSMVDMDRYPDARRRKAEETMAVQSVAMAAQNLWLMAHAQGLGACWLCAPLFVPELVRDVLQLPRDWQAQGLMTLGWPAEEKVKGRRPWREAVRFL
ncbi:MAG: nitroreductase family protein [Candidatus Promineifilaceae bacterium]|nr:nitroreductase family protein [Candidatus Promineifilaceae bacterium]